MSTKAPNRDYKFTLNDDQISWSKPVIKGTELYALAKVSTEEAVFLVVLDGENRLVEPDDLIDLTASGVEHFISAPKPATTFEIIVNAQPHIVNDRQVTFEQVVQLAFPGYQSESNVTFSMTYRPRRLKAPCRRAWPWRRYRSEEKGNHFQCYKDRSVLVPT